MTLIVKICLPLSALLDIVNNIIPSFGLYKTIQYFYIFFPFFREGFIVIPTGSSKLILWKIQGCQPYYLALMTWSKYTVIETLPCTSFVNYAVSWFHAARVIVALLTRETRERRAWANTIRTAIVFSAYYAVGTWQSIVVCPGELIVVVTILSNDKTRFNNINQLDHEDVGHLCLAG